MQRQCVCCHQYFEALRKKETCGRCELIGLKKIKTEEQTILQQLNLSWMGRYYSTLDPETFGRFYIKTRRRKGCHADS